MESGHHACSDTQTTPPGAHLVTRLSANEQVREVGLPSTCCLESICSQKSLLESSMGKKREVKTPSEPPEIADKDRNAFEGTWTEAAEAIQS